jgi:hypothetical protein
VHLNFNKDTMRLVGNSGWTVTRWIGIAAFLSGALFYAVPMLPQAKAGSKAGFRDPRVYAKPPTSECDEPPTARKASKADQGAKEIAGLLQAIAVFILEDKNETEDRNSTRVEALSRDSGSKTLVIPLLATSMRQTIVAGKRPFHIAWVGGKPPFSAELIGPSGATVARWPQTTEHSVAATVSLEEGFYELSVTDASGQPVFGAFEATPQPPMVDRRGVEQLPPDLGAALMAARLADIDDGAWQLEAYERLTAEPGGEAARIIAKRLAQGFSVSELRQQGAQLR